MYNFDLFCAVAYKGFLAGELWKLGQNGDSCFAGELMPLVARSLPKEETRTRRVDKGKSGQAQKTAVSGGFGGGILSQD